MNKNSPQRFQKTSQLTYFSPTNSPKQYSPRYYHSRPLAQTKNPAALIKSLQRFSKKDGEPPQVQDRITTLQKMLQKQKKKRQLQFSQLIAMINSIKIGQQKNSTINQREFNYKQPEFPMTPRNNYRENESQISRSPKNKKNFQTYTPVYQPAETQSISENQKQLYSYSHLNKNLQYILLKIQKQTEINVSNIAKLQQEVISSKSMQKVAKVDEIPISIQKYVKQEYKLIKNQMDTKNKNLQLTILKQLDNKLDQKQIKFNQKIQKLALSKQNTNLYDQIQNMRQILRKEIEKLQQKTQNQVFTLNQILQQKFNFFKQSLFDQLQRNNKDDSIKRLTDMIIKQRERIDELQETNGTFYSDLEKNIQNIQKKVKLIKVEDIHPVQKQKQRQNIDLLHIIRQEKQNVIRYVNSELNKFFIQFQKKIEGQIKSIQIRIDSLQDSFQIPPMRKLLKQNSISICTQKTIGTAKDLNHHHEWTPPISYDNRGKLQYPDQSFEDSNKFPTYQEIQLSIQKNCNDILQLVSQNFTFLEARNCTIQQSIGEIVWVLNGLVEKIKYLK